MSKPNPFVNRIIGYGTKPADQFMANEMNYRTHPQKQREAVQASLRELGWIGVVVENVTSGKLIDGHERVWQALKNNEDVPYIQVALSEDEEKLALAIFDPITYMAETDAQVLDALLREVNTGEAALQALLAGLAEDAGLVYGDAKSTQDAEPQIDRAEELRQQWGVESGQLWQLGEHRLVCGDCTDADVVARVMGGEKAQLCFTSPPYSDQRTYTGEGELSPQHLAKFIACAAPHVELCVVNLGIKREDGAVVEYWQHYIDAAKKCGLKLLAWNVWSRHGFGGSVGNMTAMFPIEHEWILVFGERPQDITPTVPNKHGGKVVSATVRDADGSMSAPQTYAVRSFGKLGSVFVSDVARGIKDHPAMFPTELPAAYIEACCAPGHAVCEPFSGSGTTIIACEQLGRKCRAIEISPGYVAVALQRWSDATGKTPVLLEEPVTSVR